MFFYFVDYEKLCPMNEELKRKFLQKKLEDILNDHTVPFLTILCERDEQHIQELVRKYCLLSGVLVPFRIGNSLKIVPERLDRKRGQTKWGDLYIEVFVN